MTDGVRKYLGAQPFKPFRVNLSDGRSFVVEHPELAWLTPKGGVFIALGDEADTVERFSGLHISTESYQTSLARRQLFPFKIHLV